MDPDSYLCRLADIFNGIVVTPVTAGETAALLAALVLLYVSGLVSASETAFFSLSSSDREEINEGEHPADRRVKTLLDDSEHLLATILISNNFMNVAVVLLLDFFFFSVVDFGPFRVLGLVLMTILLTFLILMSGEIIPKIYSAQHPLAFVRKAAPTVCVLRAVFSPLSSLLVRSSFFINRFARKNRPASNLSVGDLSQALELTDIEEETPEESNMLEGIIRFGEETAKEVMTSRLDMVDIEIKTPFSGVLKCVVDNGYSRIPVYEDSRDNIKGILYIKDLLPYLDRGDEFKWQNLVRPALFVPETKMIDDLLRDFQANKIHIAVVVDEFGGTSGIVTMEDLIEEIVGEINDEYDDDERTYVKLSDNVFVFEAKTLLSDFYKIVKVDSDELEEVARDSDTLAGLVLELKGEFPALHEVLEYRNFRFEVLEMNSRRILKVKVVILPPTAGGEAEKENS